MRFTAPTGPEPTGDERELLLRFLQTQRELVVWATADLTDEQARWRPDGDRLIALIGIVNHLVHVERRWIDGSYARQPVDARDEGEFTVVDRTLGEVVGAYAQRAEDTERTVRAAPSLEVPCVTPPGFMSDAIDLRWVLLHLIEETAHHAGHADATRELLDGRSSGW
jgi:uncharacterized damage-inducible protein DinB